LAGRGQRRERQEGRRTHCADLEHVAHVLTGLLHLRGRQTSQEDEGQACSAVPAARAGPLSMMVE
jgi:hypothetical protein